MNVRGVGERIPVRKTRSDKKPKVQSYVSQDIHDKINRLARACGTSESKIVEIMVEYLANNEQFVAWIQDRHKVSRDDPFRIIPRTENGKILY